MDSLWRLACLGTMLSLLMGLAAPAPVRAGDTGTLTIHVYNTSPEGGMLRLGLYDAAGYPDDDSTPVAAADVPARMGENVIVLKGIAPGTYAIETFQDINANGKMDTSWIGLPLEPFGFSRDTRPLFSKPRFAAVAFHVAAGDNEQALHLQNSISLIAGKAAPVAGY